MTSSTFRHNPIIKQGLIFHFVPNANLNFARWREQLFVLHEGGYLVWYKDPGNFEKGLEEEYIIMPRVSKFVAVGSYTQRAPKGPPALGPTDRLMAIATKPSPTAPILWLYFFTKSELQEWMKALYMAVQPYGQCTINADLMRPMATVQGIHSASPSTYDSTEDMRHPYRHPFCAAHLRRLMDTGLGQGLGWGLAHQNVQRIVPLPESVVRVIFGGYEKANTKLSS